MTKTSTLVQRYAILGVFVGLFVIFAVTVPSFLTLENVMNIIVQSSILGVVGLGLNLVMMSGEIDISFSGSVPLLASVFALLLQRGVSIGLAFGAICGMGVLIALINALLVTRLRLNSFVATIAVTFLLTGIWYAFTGGSSIWVGDTFDREWVYGYVGPMPRIGLILLSVFLVLYVLSEHTRFAMALRAVSASPDAARAAGIGVERTKMYAFVGAGLIFASSSVLSIARLSGAMATAGADIMMPVMTIAFVGQCMLGMGRPNMPGVLIGTLLLGMVNNAFVLMRLPFWSVPMAYGVILMSSIALANIGRRDITQVRM